MAEKLRLFVSATNDLENERAVIGRAVADLPVKIGVEIRRTPVHGVSYDDMFELIANCDRVYFLLGRDITAPAGAEWHLAWKLERSVLPLRLVGRRTPAAYEFMRGAFVEWQDFHSVADLARIITLDLVRILNHPANRYGLTVTDLELLSAHARRVSQGTPAAARGDEPGGAEGGGILLDAAHGQEADDELLVAS
ncbi:MAG TPA: hypothetical protein VNK95_21110 [Caldilineaceae bacterium]|nr:hypothetical protein [Caldilineaceae bacterium]